MRLCSDRKSFGVTARFRSSLFLAVAASVVLGASSTAIVGQGAPQGPPPAGRGGPPPQGRGGGGLSAGAADQHVVDGAAADRARKLYASECVQCHGPQARGTADGPNLVRSVIVLKDRYGNEIGPYLKKGHKTQSGGSSATFSDEQIQELSHFLHQRVTDTLRGSPIFEVQNVLTGDPKAGEAYFTGAGKCATCHQPSGDLAGIGRRYQPPALQQRFLFPGGGRGGRGRGAAPSKPTTVAVTTASGTSVSGTLVRMDDFTVALRDGSGNYQSFTRTPDLKVVKTNPYQAHIDLLDVITDKNMHDVVAYLETLK